MVFQKLFKWMRIKKQKAKKKKNKKSTNSSHIQHSSPSIPNILSSLDDRLSKISQKDIIFTDHSILEAKCNNDDIDDLSEYERNDSLGDLKFDEINILQSSTYKSDSSYKTDNEKIIKNQNNLQFTLKNASTEEISNYNLKNTNYTRNSYQSTNNNKHTFPNAKAFHAQNNMLLNNSKKVVMASGLFKLSEFSMNNHDCVVTNNFNNSMIFSKPSTKILNNDNYNNITKNVNYLDENYHKPVHLLSHIYDQYEINLMRQKIQPQISNIEAITRSNRLRDSGTYSRNSIHSESNKSLSAKNKTFYLPVNGKFKVNERYLTSSKRF